MFKKKIKQSKNSMPKEECKQEENKEVVSFCTCCGNVSNDNVSEGLGFEVNTTVKRERFVTNSRTTVLKKLAEILQEVETGSYGQDCITIKRIKLI